MPDLYQHYKGGLYRMLHTATDEATMLPVVVYQAIKDDSVWVRSRDVFFGTIHGEECGKAVRIPRFRFVGKEEKAANG